MERTLLEVTSEDGARSALEAFDAPELPDDAPVALLLPAMGVQARFYNRLALPLAQRGIRLITAEQRGHGRSEVRPGRAADFGYVHLLECDLPASIQRVRARHPASPVVLLGHSLGGQMAALYCSAQPGQVTGFVTVAACSVYWRAFPPGKRLPVLVGTQLASLVGRVWGTFPGHRLGFAGHEATGVIRDWARQSRDGRYAVSGTAVDYEGALRSNRTPGLVLSLHGDELAPRSAVRHLAQKMPAEQITLRHLDDEGLVEQPRVHFDWVRAPGAILGAIDEWLPRA
ncbi:MAG: alpha/beta fold hydrolase [Myxococcales bacterium]|nr:alpha/beta fold hydrolase [Myxococcales bacterium]